MGCFFQLKNEKSVTDVLGILKSEVMYFLPPLVGYNFIIITTTII